MNFKFRKRKVAGSLVLSILGSLLALYFISINISPLAEIEQVSEGVLGSLRPTGIPYLIILFVCFYIIGFVLIFIIWSLLEKR